MVNILGNGGYIGVSPKLKVQGGVVPLRNSVENDFVTSNLIWNIEITAPGNPASIDNGGNVVINNTVTSSSPLSGASVNGNSSITITNLPDDTSVPVLTFGNIEGTAVPFLDNLKNTLTYSSVLTRNVTADIWFKPSAAEYQKSTTILQIPGGIGILVMARPSLDGNCNVIVSRLVASNGAFSTFNSATDLGPISNTWNHVVFRLEESPDGNSGKFNVVINGNSSSVTNLTYLIPSPPLDIRSIAIPGQFHQAFTPHRYQGYIGSVKIYDRLLTDDEVKINYNSMKSRYNG